MLRLYAVFICSILFVGIELNAQCIAGYAFVDDGLTIQFTDESDGGGSPVTQWLWDFDDGGTSTEQNPIHTFPNADKYTVCLMITTQNGCTDEYCFEIEICTLILSATIGQTCDGNGMITAEVTISDPYDQAISINVSLDGVLVPGSPFDIDDVAPVFLTLMVPGDGLNHTIIAQSEQVGHCNVEYTFTTTDCNSNCFLSSLNIQFAGGVLHSVMIGDNFFSPANLTIQAGDIVEWNWSAGGHSTTSDATSGPDSWNSGVLGQGASYQRTIYNPGLHPYYCIPHGGPGGVGMSATIVSNCPSGNNFTLNISFNTTVADPQGFNLLLDGIVQPGSPFSYQGTGQNNVTMDLAGDGLPHTIEIQDVADPTCVLMGNVNAPDCGQAPTCMLGVSAMVVSGCDVADMVDVSITVTEVNGGGGGFRVRVDGVIVVAQMNYDPSGTTVLVIPVTGDGASHAILIEDLGDPACSASTAVVTENCAIACMLSGLTVSTGSATTHIVEVQDFQFVPQHINITSGDLVEFSWTGDVQHTSTSDAISGPDSWDSGLLGFGATFTTPVLSEGVHPYYCIPHGGPGGVGMSGTITVMPDCTNGQVAVTVSFTESGGGFSGYNILVDQNIAPESPFMYSPDGQNTVVVLVPGDGLSHEITVIDIDDPACVISMSIVTPNCGVSTCQLAVQAAIIGACDTNQMIPVQVTVTSLNTGTSGFQILVDGVVSGGSPYLYHPSGINVLILLLPGDGSPHIIVAEDIDDPACVGGTNITLPDCTLPCQIFDLEVLPPSTVTHIVEVRDFAFSPQHLAIAVGDTVRFVWTGQVSHTTTSDTTSGPDSWDSGLLNNGAVFEVVLSEAGVHPYYCIPHGGPGGIGMSGTITALADCENGLVNVSVSFQQSGGALNGFFVAVDNDTLNADPFPYALSGPTTLNIPVTGDGMSHTIYILDAVNSDCNASVDVITADCNAVPCALNITATITGGCTQDGLVPVEVVVTSVSGSIQGFNVFVDGIVIPGSPFAYDSTGVTTFGIFLPGDSAMHQIFIHDIGDVSCTAIIPIEAPDCSGQCVIDNFNIEFAQPALQIVEVRDFEFFPKHLKITLGDTVRFIWTGQVAHTSTSDTTSGPDTWGSALLGNGAVFELVLTTPGVHPYYCIPHGGPGGIGMAGTITVEEKCAADSLWADICFQVSNGLFGGYQVTIDGSQYGPFAYSGNGINCLRIAVAGDGLPHTIQVNDVEYVECGLDTIVQFPDCNDPCFGFNAGFSYTYDPQTLEVEFINQSSSGAVGWVWNLGDGEMSTEENPVHMYDSAQFYEVCLIASDGVECIDTICQNLPLGDFICEAAFQVTSDGLSITVTDTSVTSAPVDNRVWSFGDGQIVLDEDSVSHTYQSLGVYDVCLSIQADSCMETVCQTLDLSNPCLITKADFSYVVSAGTQVQFTDMSSGDISSRLWGFGDGAVSSETNPSHLYEAPGTYTVCLLVFDVQNNCVKFVCREVEIQTTGIGAYHGIRPLILFPNPLPAEDPEFTILGLSGNDLGGSGQLNVFTSQGRLIAATEVYCDEQITFRLPGHLSGGMYVAQLTTGINMYSGKFVIH